MDPHLYRPTAPVINVRHVNPDGSQIQFRPLELGDWGFCRRLASDPGVRAASFNPEPPTFWGHLKWMWKWAATSNGGVAIVIERRAVITGRYLSGFEAPTGPWGPVGLFRAAVLPGNRLEASVALLPDARGKGVGTESIALLSRWVAEGFGWPLYARIKMDNAASLAAFVRAGYATAGAAEWDSMTDTEVGQVMVLRWQGRV